MNSAEWLGDEFNLLIVTRDHDLGSATPYPDITYDKWMRVGPALVLYLAPKQQTIKHLQRLVVETPHDVLHLNSFFDPVFTIKLLFLRRLGLLPNSRVLLSPRGEFGWGSLKLKYLKKCLYILLSRLAGFYRHVFWHASSPLEAEDIVKVARVDPDKVLTALDLPVRVFSLALPPDQSGDRLKVVYLARLTREKNLDGALRLLQGVSKSIDFDIVGPKEDAEYWGECAALLTQLPGNIRATYRGAVPPDQVFQVLGEYDLMLLPSHGENYGHVIAEAISVGTRVLISTLTPWRGLESDGVGWDIDLEDRQRYAEIIDMLAAQPPAERRAMRRTVREAAKRRLSNPVVLQHNRDLYSSV
jgi:glycosyltransferase involved in cell wall biosynthesis